MGMEAIGYLIKRVDEAFKQAMDQALVVHTLSTATYAALHHLHYLGTMSSSDLARASWVTPQTMHRLVLALKERGYVEVDSTQGRTVWLKLTEAGRESFQRAQIDVAAIETRLVSGLTEPQTEALRAMLQTCHASLADGGIRRTP